MTELYEQTLFYLLHALSCSSYSLSLSPTHSFATGTSHMNPVPDTSNSLAQPLSPSLNHTLSHSLTTKAHMLSLTQEWVLPWWGWWEWTWPRTATNEEDTSWAKICQATTFRIYACLLACLGACVCVIGNSCIIQCGCTYLPIYIKICAYGCSLG